jgi:isopentenyl-diphosphate delta-isomerase type 1
MDRKDLIKNMAVGFIPVFVFIAVDEIYGTEAGLYVAVAIGLISMIYYLIRYRRLEKMLLFDTILLIVLGGVSMLLRNDIFFKLKPAIIELILVILVGIHAFSSQPILLMMGRRYLGDLEIPEVQHKMMRQMSRLLFVVLALHTGLIIYAAYFMSSGAWAFISGGLFYLLFGLIIAGQWLYGRYIKKKTALPGGNPAEEWFSIVDENGRVIGKTTRQAAHRDPRLLHPSVCLLIFNRKHELLLQKRSQNKDLYPQLWDASATGHVSFGETIEQALTREVQEELGIALKNSRPLFRYISRNERESELVHVFSATYDGAIHPNPDEIETVRFWSSFEIKRLVDKGVFTPNFEKEIKALIQLKML